MASIPRDLVTQVNLAHPRTGTKALADADPFSFVLQTPATPPKPAPPPKPTTGDSDSHPHATDDRQAPAVHENESRAPDEDDEAAESGEATNSESPQQSTVQQPPANDEIADSKQDEDGELEQQAVADEELLAEAALAINGHSAVAPQQEAKKADAAASDATLTKPQDRKKSAAQKSVTPLQNDHNPDKHSEQLAVEPETVEKLAERLPKPKGTAKRAVTEGRPTPDKKNGDKQPVDSPDHKHVDQPAARDTAPVPVATDDAQQTKTSGRTADRAPRGSRRAAASVAPKNAEPVNAQMQTDPAAAVEPTANALTAESLPAEPTTTAAPTNPTAAPTATAGTRLHDHLVPRGTRKTGDAPELNSAEQNRFLQRVTRAFDAAKNRDGGIRIRLSPPELGSLRLEVRMQEGGMVARLEAETPATRSLLIDNLPLLRERLAEQGIRVEKFDVDLLDRRDQSQDQQNNGPSHEQQRHGQQHEFRQQRSIESARQQQERERRPTNESALPHDSSALGNRQGINIII